MRRGGGHRSGEWNRGDDTMELRSGQGRAPPKLGQVRSGWAGLHGNGCRVRGWSGPVGDTNDLAGYKG